MKLSVIVPSIRPKNLLSLYESMMKSGVQYAQYGFEMIVVSPNELPNSIHGEFGNIELIQSWRSPNACQQQGLIKTTGEYITFAADDGVFLPGALDYALSMAEERTIVVGKYLEGDNPHPDMSKEAYYKFGYHKAYRLPGVPQENLIFNCGIISRNFMLELGGWDAQNFECTTCAHADLGIRAIKAGAEMILMDEPLFKCSHQPGKTGDHKPIHEAMKRDLKTFKRLYSKPRETNISLDNWKNTPERWAERFGK